MGLLRGARVRARLPRRALRDRPGRGRGAGLAVRKGERLVEPVAQALSRGLQRLERIANRRSDVCDDCGVRQERTESASAARKRFATSARCRRTRLPPRRPRSPRRRCRPRRAQLLREPEAAGPDAGRRRPADGRDLRAVPEDRRARGRARQDRRRGPALDRDRPRLQRRSPSPPTSRSSAAWSARR